MGHFMTTYQKGKSFLTYLLAWEWVEKFLYWLIKSAGTISGCCFLLAAVWVSLNASIHPFLLNWFTEGQTSTVTGWAQTAYIALPECIVLLAMITTFSQLRMVRVNGKFYIVPLVWTVLYGAPTVIFLIITVTTISNSVVNVKYTMDANMVIARALAGYGYSVVHALYKMLQVPQYKDKLEEKDRVILALQEEVQRQGVLIEKQENCIQDYMQTVNRLESEQSRLKENIKLIKSQEKSSAKTFENLPKEIQMFLQDGNETAEREIMIQYIRDFMHISESRIEQAIALKQIRATPRNANKFFKASVKEWLLSQPERPLRVVND